MKALTLTQPWATLVAVGAKKIETRGWSTSYRGPLLIHAGKGLGPVGGQRGLVELCQGEPFASVLAMHGIAWGNLVLRSQMPLGAIVAAARLVACEPTERGHLAASVEVDGMQWEFTDQERAFGDYTPGRYAWLLADVKPLAQPVPCKGALSLWTPPADILAKVLVQLKGTAYSEEQAHGV